MQGSTLLCFAHLRALTDDTGIVQFSFHGIPDLGSGYTTDDNARALIVTSLAYERGYTELEGLLRRYLAFLRYVQRPDGWVHNFVRYDRTFCDERGSEDSFGHTLWALATVVRTRALPLPYRSAAEEMLRRALPQVEDLRYPRGWALALLGLCTLHQQAVLPSAEPLCHRLASRLVELYRRHADRRWRWFEDTLTYANALLCEALLQASAATETASYREVALEALSFLNEVCTLDGVIAPVGNRGWYRRGGQRALFGQQPVDVFWLSWANWSAWRLSAEESFRQTARKAVRWFFGDNVLGKPLYDPITGACHDGLEAEGVNLHCGAESTLAALLTLLRAQQEDASLELIPTHDALAGALQRQRQPHEMPYGKATDGSNTEHSGARAPRKAATPASPNAR